MRKVLPWVVVAIVAAVGLYCLATLLVRSGHETGREASRGLAPDEPFVSPDRTATSRTRPFSGTVGEDSPDEVGEQGPGSDADDEAIGEDDGVIRITGHVYSPGGKPIAGADVWGEGLHGWATTDETGQYEIELGEESYDFSGSFGDSAPEEVADQSPSESVEAFYLVAHHPSYAVTTVGPFPRDRPPAEVDITLVEGGRIAGYVVDGARKRVACAYVTVEVEGEARKTVEIDAQYSRMHLRCDTDGAFATDVLLPGRYVVNVAPQHEALSAGEDVVVQVPANGTTDGIELRLLGGYELSGWVLDLDENPVPGAFVEAGENAEEFLYRAAVADKDGFFVVRGLPSEEIDIYAKADTFRDAKVQCAPPEADLVIRLRPAPRIVGRVVDKATQEPITRFVVGAHGDDPSALGFRSVFGEGGVLRRVESADGSFQLTVQDPGRQMVAVGAEGYAVALLRGVEPLDVTEPEPILVQLVRGATVTVFVTSAQDGKPVPEAQLRLKSREFEKEFRGDFENWPGLPTGEDGTCIIPNVPPGRHEIVVGTGFGESCDGTVFEISEQDLAKTVGVVVGEERWCALRGTVVTAHDGSPVAGATVEAAVLYGGFGEEDSSSDPLTCATDADGAFVLDQVPSTWLSLSLEAEGFAPHEQSIFPSLETDEDIVVRMRRLAQITGIVSTRDGRPIAGAPIRLNCTDSVPNGPCSAETDEVGRYTLSQVASGCNTVTVSYGASFVRRDILVAPGQVARADFVFGTASVFGTITQQGVPQPDIDVFVETRSKGFSRPAGFKTVSETDEYGRYRLGELLPGEYTVFTAFGYRVEDGPPGTNYVSRDVTVGDTDVQLDIELEPAEPMSAVRGTVVLHNGWPGAEARLWLVPGSLTGTRSEQLARACFGDVASSSCDEQGAFCIQGVQPGRYTLVVSRTGYALSTTPVDKLDGQALEGLKIALQPEASVLAEVRCDEDWQPEKVGVRVYDASGAMLSLKQTDYVPNDGSFRISGLGPGTFVLVAGTRDYAPCRREVTVPREGQAQVLFEFKWGQSASVIVRDNAGRPVPFATVVLDVGGDAFAAAHAIETHEPLDTDERGSVTIYNLADGDYTLHVQCDGYEDASVPVAIAGRDAAVTVTLRAAAD